MPAPLGRTPTSKMPDIQVFGATTRPPTRAALRFFRERRIVVHYVDLRKRRHRARRAAAVHRAARRGGAARPDLAPVPRRGPRPPDARRGGHRPTGCSPTRACCGCRSSATGTRSPPVATRTPGPPGSSLGRACHAVQPTTTPRTRSPRRRSPSVMSPTMNPEPVMNPVPWPIQTRPTTTQDGRDDPASAHRHLLGGILARWTR